MAPEPLIAALATREAAGAVLAGAAALTLVVGSVRARGAFGRHAAGALFVLLAALPLGLLPAAGAWATASLAAAGLALVAHLVLDRGAPRDTRALDAGGSGAALACLALALVVAAVLMWHDLGGYAGTLQRWEATVVHRFAEAYARGTGPAEYALDRLRWSSGILSLSAESLLFGAPTYALFHVLGFSPWTLRVAAVGALLLAIVAVFAVARRFFGLRAAGAAALLVAVNECALFYGRYGTAAAATVLTVTLAVGATWLLLERDRAAWWLAVPCAAALYLATLHYAPGRIVVLILLGFVPLVMACQWRRFGWRRAVALAVVAGAVVLVWQLQGPRGQNLLFSGQGEHFFHMTKSPEYVASFCPSCRDVLPDERAYQMALLRRWLGITVPEYLGMIGPRVETAPLRDWAAPVFPRLYYGPLAVFLVWGVVHSLRRWRSVPHAGLLVWVALATIPLLLTNRVDAHRTMLFVVPFSLWAALGVAEAARVMTGARVPRWVQGAAGAALLATVVAHDVRILWRPSPPPSPASVALDAEVARIPGPVAVGALIDPPADTLRDLYFVALRMLERQRLDPARRATVLSYQLVAGLRDGAAPPPEARLAEVEEVARRATVVLAPAWTFRAAAAALRARGAAVVETGGPDLEVLRIEAPPAGEARHPPRRKRASAQAAGSVPDVPVLSTTSVSRRAPSSGTRTVSRTPGASSPERHASDPSTSTTKRSLPLAPGAEPSTAPTSLANAVAPSGTGTASTESPCRPTPFA